jgi:hypothetical protein
MRLAPFLSLFGREPLDDAEGAGEGIGEDSTLGDPFSSSSSRSSSEFVVKLREKVFARRASWFSQVLIGK